MRTAPVDSLLHEYRTHRMARFAVWVLAYGAALWVVGRTAGGVPGFLWFLFWASLIVLGIYYLVRVIGVFQHRVLWRLRWRLVVTYLFIAVVPIVLLAILVVVGAAIINGQFATFLVSEKMRVHFDQLRQMNRVVAHQARESPPATPENLIDRLQKFYVSGLAEHAASYPGLEVTVRLGKLERAFRLDGKPMARAVSVPAWFHAEEFAGIVNDDGQLALRAIDRTPTAVGDLVVTQSLPFTPELLDLLGEGIGPVGVLVPYESRLAAPAGTPPTGFRPEVPADQYVQSGTIRTKSIKLPEPAGFFDFSVLGTSTLNPTVWSGEKEQRQVEPVLFYASSRIVSLNRRLLGMLGELSDLYVILFWALAVVLLVLEASALVIGVLLTRSMTRTVDRLHIATEKVKAGEFSHRIGLPARDQLSALGQAFDGMTASVERLLRESQEKSRLESEIEIAREVQKQLFPRAAPEVPGLLLYGVCKPASAVGGDYYDFLGLGGGRVGLVLGDVSGKGISGALLMATIRAALHAQFRNGMAPAEDAEVSTAEIVARLNRQLFESSPTEKYATFFYAVYEQKTRRLTYTNAGHWPPVLFRKETVKRLEAGGIALGLFASMGFEQAEVQLEPDDLLLAFTDGIIEPENSYGEEFGEGRVLEVVRRELHSPPEVLVEEISRSVTEWTGSPELQDDMTMLVAKALR